MNLVDPLLKETYEKVKETDRRAAAEIAYALGMECKRAGDYEGMRRYREESITLFNELGLTTLDEVSPMYGSINEIHMPDYIHEGIVATHLSEPNP